MERTTLASTSELPNWAHEGIAYSIHTSWGEYLTATSVRTTPVLYRGQRDPKWTLQSLWERDLDPIREVLRPGRRPRDTMIPGAFEANRDAFLRHFKEQVQMLTRAGAPVPQTDASWWAFGRHQGLITPLLDWTTNPEVAAFFAMIDWVDWINPFRLSEEEEQRRRQECQYVAIWQLTIQDGLFDEGVFELVDVEHPSSRQQRQSGMFTMLLDDKHTGTVDYLRSRGLTRALHVHLIPSHDCSLSLANLHDRGIHYASLFPDPYGAAMYANFRQFVKPQSLEEYMKGAQRRLRS